MADYSTDESTMSKKGESAEPGLTVFRGWVEQGCHVWSPFVTKLELRLRLSKTPYAVGAGSPSTAPSGKIPYIEIHPKEGGAPLLLGDSTLIVERLVELDRVEDLNTSISPLTRVHDLALRALMEEKLYFYLARERWLENYYVKRDKALCEIPYPIRLVVGLLIHRKISQMLYGQGTGRYTAAEIAAFRKEIWESINVLLESSARQSRSGVEVREPFWCLGGPRPTEADTTLFGFIVTVLVSAANPESTEVVKTFPVILDYADRIHTKYFPDYRKWE